VVDEYRVVELSGRASIFCQSSTIISMTRPPIKIKQKRKSRERGERREREIERREVWLNDSKRSHE